MTEETITSEEALLHERMDEAVDDAARSEVLRAMVSYRSSWVGLGEHLNMVANNRQYKEWGYKTFKDYCESELQLPQTTARKLVRGYQWVDRELDEQVEAEVTTDGEPPEVYVPDVETVNALIQAEREVSKERIQPEVYQEIKRQALDEGFSARQVRQQTREAIPEELRDGANQTPEKVLKKTLNAAEKILGQLDELGASDALLDMAMHLRDALHAELSARLGSDEEAPAEAAGDGVEAAASEPAEPTQAALVDA